MTFSCYNSIGQHVRGVYVRCSLAMLVLLTVAAPGVWSWASRLRRRRRAEHHDGVLCPACGYDLGATPERCPECGALTDHGAGLQVDSTAERWETNARSSTTMSKMEVLPVSSLSLLGTLILAVALCPAPPAAGLEGRDGVTSRANAPRAPERILADLAATPLPAIDVPAIADPAYAKDVTARRDAARRKRAALAIELYRAAPAAPEVAALMAERWETLAQAGSADAALSEMEEYLRGGLAAKERLSASYQRARLRIQYQAKDTAARLAAIEEFKAAAVGQADARPLVAQLLYTTGRLAPDTAEKERLMARVVAEYPDSPPARVVRGVGRKRAAVGATMELTFKDAITGKRVDLADFRGRVVVVDFWAAWCTDCAAEMPYMKRIYAETKGKGVQFVGVSLDVPEEEGGLRDLRASVARFGIDWPQYYPGGKFDSEFSSTWGVFAVPTVFVLDRNGVIVSTDARGKLETILPKLLERSEP